VADGSAGEIWRERIPDLQFTLIAADSEIDFTEANLDLAIQADRRAGRA
jgi:hypothetical protein